MKKFITLICLSVAVNNWGFAQQTCSTPQIVSAGTVTIPVIDGIEVPALVCATGGSGSTAANWYKYTPAQNYTVTVTTDFVSNGNVDNRVHVFSGTCSSLVCVAGDDDSGTNTLCIVTFDAMANTDYYIVFDNLYSSVGFMFELIENPPVVPNPTAVTFSPVVNNSISENTMAVADMNGDFLDDIVSISSTNIQIQEQNLNGTFTNTNYTTTAAQNSPSWSLAVGDYNADGYNDLLYGGGSGVTFMKSNGSGTGYTQVSGTEYVFSQRSNFVDMNNDGNLDAFVCHDIAPNVYYLNDGNGNLSFNQGGVGDISNGGNYGSIWVDYNNDLLPDLFIAKCRGGFTAANINEMHRNNGDGTFTNVSISTNLADSIQTWSSAWNDFDNDGWMDVLVGASSDANGMHKLMRNNGNGTFSNITAGTGIDTFFGLSIEYVSYDFNNDGFADVFTPGTILFNNGNNTFSAQSVPMGAGGVGDLNNDGFLDVQNGSITYLNNGNSNNWLTVTLEGTTSNKNGIGARVEIYGAWGKQIRDVRSGVGFSYMGTLNAHFGIGSATQIDSLIVRWPSGNVDLICAPDTNSVLHVIESSSPSPTAAFTANADVVFVEDSVLFTDASTICPSSWNWTVEPTIGWEFSNTTSATSQNPSITFTEGGTYVVSLVSSNANGASTNLSSDTIVVNLTVGLSENTMSQLSVYPNPVVDVVNLKLNKMPIKSVRISSILGSELEVSYNRTNNTIPVSQLKPGIYLVSVTTESNQVLVTRFIKK